MQTNAKILILLLAFVLACPAVVNAQTNLDSLFYSFVDRGGLTVATIGGTSNLTTGYARLQPGAGTTPPAAFGIVGYRRNNVLVSEGSIPGVRPVTSGRTYVEVGSRVNTAVAFVNTNSLQVTVTFQLTDDTGNSTGASSITLGPGAQSAMFLSDFPFNLISFVGSLSFTATAPIGVAAIHTFTNQRSDFLITSQPVVSTQSASNTLLVLPHFADGGGWATQVVLLNSTDQVITGTVQFFGEGTTNAAATAVNVVMDGISDSLFNYRIPARSAAKFVTSGTSSPLQSGSVRVTPSSGSPTPAGFTLFSLTAGGITITRSSSAGDVSSSAFRLYVEASGTLGQTGSIQTAVAIANTSSSPATVNFELWTSTGVSTGVTGSITIPAFGHAAKFFSDIFPAAALPVSGLLRVTAATSQVVIAALRARYNERQEFLMTATPSSNELAPIAISELIIPQVADQGGYSTQFVLFSGTLNQSALGTMRFLDQIGQSISFTFR